jgi:hypothetical protein
MRILTIVLKYLGGVVGSWSRYLTFGNGIHRPLSWNGKIRNKVVPRTVGVKYRLKVLNFVVGSR